MSQRFENKRILVAVTGGIAAYKACELIRLIETQGGEAIALMTSAATRFVGPLTLESLTKKPVYLENLENTVEGIPTHIKLAQEMDAMLVVPCSANTLAKLAHGVADNLLSTTAITFTGKPIIIAPAMNTRMWENPLVQKNLSILSALDNVTIVPPGVGELACGEWGEGKMADLETILLYTYKALHPQSQLYRNKRIIVTAGGTAEPMDAVRYLTNKSSGLMGLALADELFAMGAEVSLIHTLGSLNKPYQCTSVKSASEMAEAVKLQFVQAAGLVMAAAVSDFKIKDADATQKIKKQDELTLILEKNEDILKSIAPLKRPDQFVIGFAAESNNIEDYARKKLSEKNLDLIVANDVSRSDIGFGANLNEVTLVFPNSDPITVNRAPKQVIAREILNTFYEKQLRSHFHNHVSVDTTFAE